MTSYQVSVAAEAYAVVTMSQAGYDVSIQYGTTQPDWDLRAKKENRTLDLSVKGSQDGGWGLFQGHLKHADYHGALEKWLKEQPEDIVYFLVQFRKVKLGEAPRCYIVRPKEIVKHMHSTRGGHAYTSLREKHTWTRGAGAGHTDLIPQSWLVSQARIDDV